MFPRYFILSLALLWIGVVQGETVSTSSNLSVNENAGTTTITVERVGSSEGEFSANYATRDETAIAGEDYEAATGTLTWRDGEIGPKDFLITIKNDEEFEEDETFYVEIKDSASNVLATTTLTILDDDGENKSSSAAETLMNTAKNSTQKEMGRVVGTVCQSGQASPRLQQR